MKRRALLVSNSTLYGGSYLEHCQEQIVEFFGNNVKRVLFVPYALHDRDAYTKKARQKFESLGYGLDSIHEAAIPVEAVQKAEGIFIACFMTLWLQDASDTHIWRQNETDGIELAKSLRAAFFKVSSEHCPFTTNCKIWANKEGGGNTFRLLKALYDNNLVSEIHRRVFQDGIPYLGSSAGANVGTVSINTTNDMPIVYPPSFKAIGLVPFNINPHYLDADPNNEHMGETREKRIEQYHEEPDTLPVMGLREGSMLLVEGDKVTLLGTTCARLFIRGKNATEHEPGTDFSFLLTKKPL